MIRRQRRRLADLSLFAGIVMGLALVALSMYSVADSGAIGVASQSDDPRGLGPRDATVQIVVYFDFQCAHCERLHATEEPELMKRYVATGKAHLEARPLPFMGPESLRAAEASLCAADQGGFWEYRDALFNAWRQSGPAVYSSQGLRQVARAVGLDQEALGSCVDSRAKQDEATAIYEGARTAGVKSVPTTIVNGEAIVGRLSLQTFVSAIDRALAQ